MVCTKCGERIADSAITCPNCGTPCGIAAALARDGYVVPQPASSQDMDWRHLQQTVAEAQPVVSEQEAELQETDFQELVEAQPKPPGRGLRLAFGVLLLAALIGASIWFLSNLTSSDSRLKKASVKSLTLLEEYLQDLPNLNTVMQNLHNINFRSGFSLGIALDRYDNSQSSTVRHSLKLDLDVDTREKKALFSTDISDLLRFDGLDLKDKLPLSYYIDDQNIYIDIGLLDEGEVLLLPVKDFANQFNASALAKLTEASVPETVNLDLFDNSNVIKESLSNGMETLYGKDWSRLRDSFETAKYEGSSPFGDKGTTYTLRWNRELLKSMFQKISLSEINDFGEQLLEMDAAESEALFAKRVIYLLGTIDEALADYPLIYVENDTLTGICADMAIPGEVRLIVQLLGENNPWEKLLLSGQSKHDGAYYTYATAELRLQKADGQLRAVVASKLREFAEETHELIYNDADGRITLKENGKTVESDTHLLFFPMDGKACFRLEERPASGIGGALTISLGSKPSNIQRPGTKTVELLKLSEEELQALEARIEAKMSSLAGASQSEATSP